MPINPKQRAEQHANTKRRMEIALYFILRRILKKMQKSIASGNFVLSFYQDDYKNALYRYYGKVSNRFKNIIKKQLDPKVNTDAIDDRLDTFNSSRAVIASLYALSTLEKMLESERAKASTLKKISRNWFERAKIHTKSIFSPSEVQLVAENSKNMTVTGIGQIKNVVYRQQWRTVGDNRVRLWHSETNGQIQDVGTPFNVGPDSLYYPGDPRGQLANIINCRCGLVVVDSVVGNDGNI